MSEDEPLEVSKKGRKLPKNAVKDKQKQVDDETPQSKKRAKGKAKEISKVPAKGDEIEVPTIIEAANLSMEPPPPRKALAKGVKQQMKARPHVKDDVMNQGTQDYDDDHHHQERGARSD